LPTRPTKRTGNTHAKSFRSEESVELDALAVEVLQRLVSDVIVQHIDGEQMEITQAAERSEHEALNIFCKQWNREHPPTDDGATPMPGDPDMSEANRTLLPVSISRLWTSSARIWNMRGKREYQRA
jgi:hypothetical protein